MRILLQVVKSSQVEIDQKVFSEIGKGFLLLIGFQEGDNPAIIEKCLDKALSLRLFADENGKINLSLDDCQGEVMLVSQFTLYADYKKGRRPSFNTALKGDDAKTLYDYAVNYVKNKGYKVSTGVFGADMKVHLINDGPTTIMIDSEVLLG